MDEIPKTHLLQTWLAESVQARQHFRDREGVQTESAFCQARITLDTMGLTRL